MAPLTLRLSYEVYAARRLSASVGAGPVAAYARVRTSLTGSDVSWWGFGGLGFASVQFALGRGHAFVELSYGYAPVNGPGFHLEAGGVQASVGYRLGVF